MFLPCIPRLATTRAPHSTILAPTLRRTFTHSPHSLSSSKPLPPRPVLLDSELIENFLKGSGPGGQKINKTSSAVQLKHIPTGIVVKYQDTRSRTVNRKMARRILQDKIEELEQGEGARTRVKGREMSRKKKSAEKKKRRKYRALEEQAGEVAGTSSEVGGEIGSEGEGGKGDTQRKPEG